ncbi:MAG TPA: BON domain-containing protein [Thermoanaerobaculia bacterium]|jgi:osmotically-inducible protein OsmY
MRNENLRTQLIAAIFAVVLIAPAAWAVQPDSKDVTSLFANSGVVVDGLRAIDVGGILVLRGRTLDPAQAEAAATYAKSLGYARVANLVRVDQATDDAKIERSIERQLALTRGLDGCNIKINSQDGAVRMTGTVQQELQKDFALELVRNVDGVKSVQSDLQRF